MVYLPLYKITDVIKDLGAYFECKLTFNCHILHIKNKALTLIGCIGRSCVDFNKTNISFLYLNVLFFNTLNFKTGFYYMVII